MTEQDNRGNIVLKWLREEHQLGRRRGINEALELCEKYFGGYMRDGTLNTQIKRLRHELLKEEKE